MKNTASKSSKIQSVGLKQKARPFGAFQTARLQSANNKLTCILSCSDGVYHGPPPPPPSHDPTPPTNPEEW